MSAPDVAQFGTHFASAYFLPNSIMHRALPLSMPTPQPLTSAAAQHFVGFVETTTDALRLIMAARQGIIPRITRRLNDSERRSMIRSGAVFVFCVEESGIKRWTEGLAWSPSRIVGNFLVYREVTERNSIRGSERGPTTPGTSSFQVAPSSTTSTSSRYRSRPETSTARSLDASGTVRANGLIKKTITVKVDGTDHHLVSYYRDEDVRLGHLPRPTTRPDIMALTIPPEMVRGTNFRHPPHIEIDSDGRARIYDAEEADTLRRQHQHDRASSVVSTSRHSYSYTSPALSLNTLSHPTVPPLSLPSPTHSSISHSSGEYDVSFNRSSGSSEGSFAPQGTYRWSTSSSLTSPVDSPTHSDRSASQFMRSTTPWQPPREYNATPSSDTYPANYYQPGVQDRTQSPTDLPQTGNTYYGSSNTDDGLSLLPPRISSSWSLPSFAPAVPSSSTFSRYYGDGGAVAHDRESLSTPLSQPTSHMFPQHSDSPYVAYRSSSLHGGSQLYPRHGGNAYSSQRDESAYDEDNL